jgi:hypothetical protein
VIQAPARELPRPRDRLDRLPGADLDPGPSRHERTNRRRHLRRHTRGGPPHRCDRLRMDAQRVVGRLGANQIRAHRALGAGPTQVCTINARDSPLAIHDPESRRCRNFREQQHTLPLDQHSPASPPTGRPRRTTTVRVRRTNPGFRFAPRSDGPAGLCRDPRSSSLAGARNAGGDDRNQAEAEVRQRLRPAAPTTRLRERWCSSFSTSAPHVSPTACLCTASLRRTRALLLLVPSGSRGRRS